MPHPIEYLSTRGGPERYQLSQAILTSTAPDGGLLVPEKMPKFSLGEISFLSLLSYLQRVEFIINKCHSDLDPSVIRNMTTRAYGNNFDHADIAPVRKLKNGMWMQELWHGPSGAFKDMSLQVMPLMVANSIMESNIDLERQGKRPQYYLILTATSGDTGKAAQEGYKDMPGCSIMVFFPHRGVSKLQELQMVTQEGNNVAAHPARGDFDAVQAAVKATFGDKPFNDELKVSNIILSSANSINWGRILPQIAYHFSAYAELLRQGVIRQGQKVDIAVPTGNFGNILAAFYAKEMGLPIGKLICASNENNVLTEFLQTGVYDITNRKLVKTPSPSMDIKVASNVERLLYSLTNDTKKVTQWMNELKTQGRFVVDAKTKKRLQEDFYAGWVSNKECLANIAHVVDETGYLIDPHTSVAQIVGQEFIDEASEGNPLIISSTAHWAKFARDVRGALIGGEENLPLEIDPEDEFVAIEQVTILVPGATVPKSIAGLAEKPVLHTTIYDATQEGVEEAVTVYLQEKRLL